MNYSSSTNGHTDEALERLLERSRSVEAGTAGSRPDLFPGTIVQRLKKKFGLGEQPDKRLALYEHLEKLHRRHPEEVERIISEAVVGATSANKPARYFCVAVKKKIVAAGLTLGDPSEATW